MYIYTILLYLKKIIYKKKKKSFIIKTLLSRFLIDEYDQHILEAYTEQASNGYR